MLDGVKNVLCNVGLEVCCTSLSSPVVVKSVDWETIFQTELPLPVTGDSMLSVGEHTQNVYESLKDYVKEHAPEAKEWRLIIALAGRAWFLEPRALPDETGSMFDLGYYDHPTQDEWNVVGVSPIEKN